MFNIAGSYFENKFSLPEAEDKQALIQKFSPADLEAQIWECPTSRKHIDPVIDSAITGFKTWKYTKLEERVEFINKYKAEVEKRKNDIAEAIALETGKPLWEALTEVQSVINKVGVTIQDSLPRINNEFYENIMPKTNGFVTYKPLGPCLVIGPFNFPCHLANGQILSALISGNSVIFKPSEKTIYSGQLLIECFHNAGFPNGVVNLINGDGKLTSNLLKEKEIKGIFFTGSKEVGIKILEQTYKDLSKMVALEMGGKNTSIICEDANLDLVLPELVKAAFMTSGQRCVATSKVAIHDKIADEFISKFHSIAKRLIVDHPIEFDKEPFMGPLIDKKSTDNYLNYMGMAIREGATEVMRGKVLERKFKGHYVSPSIHYMEKLNKKSHFIKSEIFGPNITFLPFNNLEEAIDIANYGNFGLAASVFTESESNFKKCALDIDVGICNRNRSTSGASSKLPFGGVKNSGNHRPAAVAMIDSCVYPQSGLELVSEEDQPGLESIKGLMES